MVVKRTLRSVAYLASSKPTSRKSRGTRMLLFSSERSRRAAVRSLAQITASQRRPAVRERTNLTSSGSPVCIQSGRNSTWWRTRASRTPAMRASMVGGRSGIAAKAMRRQPSFNKCSAKRQPAATLSMETRSKLLRWGNGRKSRSSSTTGTPAFSKRSTMRRLAFMASSL